MDRRSLALWAKLLAASRRGAGADAAEAWSVQASALVVVFVRGEGDDNPVALELRGAAASMRHGRPRPRQAGREAAIDPREVVKLPAERRTLPVCPCNRRRTSRRDDAPRRARIASSRARGRDDRAYVEGHRGRQGRRAYRVTARMADPVSIELSYTSENRATWRCRSRSERAQRRARRTQREARRAFSQRALACGRRRKFLRVTEPTSACRPPTGVNTESTDAYEDNDTEASATS